MRKKDQTIIFNFRTWILLIKAIMVNYVNCTENDATNIILNSNLVNHALDNYMSVVMRCHETEYH